MDDDGACYRDSAGWVEAIIFDAEDSVSNSGGLLSFADTDPSVRLRYPGFGLTEGAGRGEFDGKFVGDSIDGPYGTFDPASGGMVFQWADLPSFSMDCEHFPQLRCTRALDKSNEPKPCLWQLKLSHFGQLHTFGREARCGVRWRLPTVPVPLRAFGDD